MKILSLESINIGIYLHSKICSELYLKFPTRLHICKHTYLYACEHFFSILKAIVTVSRRLS